MHIICHGKMPGTEIQKYKSNLIKYQKIKEKIKDLAQTQNPSPRYKAIQHHVQSSQSRGRIY